MQWALYLPPPPPFLSSFHFREEISAGFFPPLFSHSIPPQGCHQIHPMAALAEVLPFTVPGTWPAPYPPPPSRGWMRMQRAGMFAHRAVPFGFSQQLLQG